MSTSTTPQTCIVRDCTYTGQYLTRRWCPRHYAFFRKHGTEPQPDVDVTALPLGEKWALWTAGVIDCEGWIGLFASRRQGKELGYWGGVAVNNTDKRLVDKLHEVTGLGTLSYQEKHQNPNAKPQWRWSVCRWADVRRLLLAIEPHLLLKAEQARLILSLPRLHEKDKPRREAIKDQIRELNRRGRSA